MLLGSRKDSQVLQLSHAGSGERSLTLLSFAKTPRNENMNMSLIHAHVVVLERFDAIPFDLSAAIVLAEPPTANLTMFLNAEGQTVCRERGIDRARNVLWPLILRAILYWPSPRLARRSAAILTEQIQTLGS